MDLKMNNLQPSGNSISQDNLKQLLDMINSVRYGSITILNQDCKVIQIEKNEKVRLK